MLLMRVAKALHEPCVLVFPEFLTFLALKYLMPLNPDCLSVLVLAVKAQVGFYLAVHSLSQGVP